MRPLLSFLALLSAALTLAFAPAASASAAADTGAHAWRSLQVTLSPQPGDLALAQLRFSHPRGRPVGRRALAAAVHGLFGADYLDAAGMSGAGRRPVVLVLLVSRVTALAMPASVRVSIRARRVLGHVRVLRYADPFATTPTAPPAGFCTLSGSGTPLASAPLAVIGSRGSALSGFSGTEAVAEAYDASCGLGYEASFRERVQPSVECPSGTGSCVPVKEPKPPGCLPCDPKPGYACPLGMGVGDALAEPAICVSAESGGATASGGH